MDRNLRYALAAMLLLGLSIILFTSLSPAVEGAGNETSTAGDREGKEIKEYEIHEIYVPLLELGLALILARSLGSLFEHWNLPTVVGEISAGVVLAFVAVLLRPGNFVAVNFNAPEFLVFGHMGIIFLLFLSGMEVDVHQLRNTGKQSFLIALGGVILPFVFGYLIADFFGYNNIEGLVIGTILTATSVGVSARTLMDLNVLHTDVGIAVLGAAVIDDVIGIVVLTLVMGGGSSITIFGYTFPVIVSLFLSMGVFFLITLYLGLRWMGDFLDISERYIHVPQAVISMSIAVCFIFAALARELEIAMITGAFIGGLVIGNSHVASRVESEIKALGYSFFIPLYFVTVGISIDLSAFLHPGIILFALVFTLTAILGKVLGSGAAARIASMSWKDSLRVGVCMVPRMEVALVVITTAMGEGIIIGEKARELLTATIIMTVLTTLLSPVLIKMAYSDVLRERKRQMEKRFMEPPKDYGGISIYDEEDVVEESIYEGVEEDEVY